MSELTGLVREIQARSALPAVSASLRLGTFGVIGAGYTGRRIAASCLRLGRVLLVDPDESARVAAVQHVRRVLRTDVRAGVLSTRGMQRLLRRFEVRSAWPRARSAGLVIECVPEDIALKRAVLAAIEPHLSPDSVWATNTSALRVADIAAAAARAERVLGMHHLLAAGQARLMELVATPATSAQAVTSAHTCAVLRGMAVLYARDAPGFFTTRVLGAYLAEALLLLLEGWSVEVIDDAAERFGFVAGPFRLLDRIGIDVAVRVAAQLLLRPDHAGAAAPLHCLLEAGCSGRKSGSGFYRYGPRSTATVNPLARTYEAALASRSRSHARQRLVLAVVNESARAVHQRVVATQADADVGAVLGIGFPAASGGPLRFAARRPGTEKQLRGLAEAHGSRFRPAPLFQPAAVRV